MQVIFINISVLFFFVCGLALHYLTYEVQSCSHHLQSSPDLTAVLRAKLPVHVMLSTGFLTLCRSETVLIRIGTAIGEEEELNSLPAVILTKISPLKLLFELAGEVPLVPMGTFFLM